MGYKRPTSIQQFCIPAVLQGRDVLGCAETGSGKTAAFALPMLHLLSMDPYGIFAIVLTPTRELAIQISEQISALGAALSVSVGLAIGGVDVIAQRLVLSRRPHFVIATPGRLRHHLDCADPPNLSKCRFLVLDEADRLLSMGFADELSAILPHLNPKRSTLLFSATFTDSLEEVEKMAMVDAARFDLTKSRKIPLTARQRYLLVPAKVKLCFLVALLRKILHKVEATTISSSNSTVGKKGSKEKDRKDRKRTRPVSDPDSSSSHGQSSLIIVFVQSCHRCHEISLILQAMELDCVALHSMLSQTQRMQSLQKFKNQLSRVLVATDVASRGLDIPAVDHVINLDMPRTPADYVHRVGRTARIGRVGAAVSFVTQHDIDLLHAIEAHTGSQLEKCEDVDHDDILPLLNPLSKAMQLVQQELLSSGILEKEALIKKRKHKQKRELLRKVARSKIEETKSGAH